jgi:predicted nucleic acid-binding protein
MKRIVIDLNILMDFFLKREAHEKVAEIFRICSEGKIEGFVCAHEITTLYYFLNKALKDKGKIKKSISIIMKYFKVIEINAEILIKALSSGVSDFEDAVIETSAAEKGAGYILTRNTRDFKKSIISPITPDEFLALQNKAAMR